MMISKKNRGPRLGRQSSRFGSFNGPCMPLRKLVLVESGLAGGGNVAKFTVVGPGSPDRLVAFVPGPSLGDSAGSDSVYVLFCSFVDVEGG